MTAVLRLTPLQLTGAQIPEVVPEPLDIDEAWRRLRTLPAKIEAMTAEIAEARQQLLAARTEIETMLRATARTAVGQP